LKKFIRAADQRLDDYLRRLDEGDVEEGGTGGGARTKNLAETIAVLREKRGHYQVILAELERGPHVQVRCSQPMTTRQHCLYLLMEMTSSEREDAGW
jgi:hypothetical protein